MPPRPRPSSAPRPPKVLQPGGGEALHVLDETATFKVGAGDGDGGLSLVELECPPGGGVPPHAHATADHVLYVLEGTFALTLDGARELLEPGACAVVPRGNVHGYANVGDGRGRLLVVASPPATEERVFLELASRLAVGPAGSTEMTAAVRLLGARHGLHVAPPDGERGPAGA